jgi:hypothetical protein
MFCPPVPLHIVYPREASSALRTYTWLLASVALLMVHFMHLAREALLAILAAELGLGARGSGSLEGLREIDCLGVHRTVMPGCRLDHVRDLYINTISAWGGMQQ